MAERDWVSAWRRLLQACLLFWAGLASGLAAGSAAGDMALDISSPHRFDLSRHLQVCAAAPEVRIEQILAGDCERDDSSPPSVSRGFDNRAFWIRLDLVNQSDAQVNRLLSLGHARLQEVNLFRLSESGLPVALGNSGSGIALNARAVPLPRPSFRLEFEPGERKILWLRVASETIVEFAPELQPLEAGYYRAQRLQMFQALAIGCMLLCFCYSMGTYLILREKTLLFFGIFMLAEIVIELTHSGMLQTYLWPASLPFDTRVLTLGVAVCIGAFSLFLRSFVPNLQSHRLSYDLSRGTLAVFYGGVLWGLLIDYRDGTLVWTYALIVWMLSVLVLIVLSWRQGSATAKILLQSFMLLTVIELIRLLAVTRRVNFREFESLGNPFAIALTSAVILIGMIRRVREMQSDLSQTKAERAASLSFMSQMSHELRSPLTTIIGQLKLLIQTALPDRARQMVETMRLDAAQLLSMIDDILDYAQGTAGKQRLHCAAQRWSNLTERIEQRARMLTGKNGNRLVFHSTGPGQAVFLVDERRLLQVLSNLLANADHYCHDGIITLSCNIEEARTGSDWKLIFSVSDTGHGIAPEDQQRVFQPFERGSDAYLSDHKGVGMGLAISRQLVQLMNGQLMLQSERGNGCRFSFEVSCQAAQADEIELDADEISMNSIATTQEPYSPQTANINQQFPVPDEDKLAQLLQLIENGQISDFVKTIEILELADPKLGQFCSTVRDLALQLDLAELRRLLSQAKFL